MSSSLAPIYAYPPTAIGLTRHQPWRHELPDTHRRVPGTCVGGRNDVQALRKSGPNSSWRGALIGVSSDDRAAAKGNTQIGQTLPASTSNL
jgi:hypothetical protein